MQSEYYKLHNDLRINFHEVEGLVFENVEINGKDYNLRFNDDRNAIVWVGDPTVLPDSVQNLPIFRVYDDVLYDMIEKEPNRFAAIVSEFPGKEITEKDLEMIKEMLPEEDILAEAHDIGLEIDQSIYDTTQFDYLGSEPPYVMEERKGRYQTFKDRVEQIREDRENSIQHPVHIIDRPEEVENIPITNPNMLEDEKEWQKKDIMPSINDRYVEPEHHSSAGMPTMNVNFGKEEEVHKSAGMPTRRVGKLDRALKNTSVGMPTVNQNSQEKDIMPSTNARSTLFQNDLPDQTKPKSDKPMERISDYLIN